MAAVLVGLGVLLFAPFWRGPATLLEPIHTLATMNPGGSIAEVMGHVVHVLRGGAMPSPEMPVRQAIELDRATKGSTWFVVSLVMRVIALVIGARLLHFMLRKPHDEGRIALGTGALVVAVITLVSHRFQSWYLLAALPFFGLSCTEVWRRWWIVITAVSVAPDFTHMLPKSAALLPIWSATTTAAGVDPLPRLVPRALLHAGPRCAAFARRRSTSSHSDGNTSTAASRQLTSPTTAMTPRLRMPRFSDPTSAR